VQGKGFEHLDIKPPRNLVFLSVANRRKRASRRPPTLTSPYGRFPSDKMPFFGVTIFQPSLSFFIFFCLFEMRSV